MCLTLFVTVTGAAVATEPVLDPVATEVRMLLFPLIGAMMATLAMFMLAPKREDTRRVFGRCIVSVSVGSPGTVAACYCAPYGELMIGHPMMMFLHGLGLAALAYVISRALAERAMAKADTVAEHLVESAAKATERRLQQSRPPQQPRLSLIHISEPTRPCGTSRMPSSA